MHSSTYNEFIDLEANVQPKERVYGNIEKRETANGSPHY
jgi:hypothetical protein